MKTHLKQSGKFLTNTKGRNAFWREFIPKSLDESETLDYSNTNEEKWITFKS